jgi:hypothetical protein
MISLFSGFFFAANEEIEKLTGFAVFFIRAQSFETDKMFHLLPVQTIHQPQH